MRKFFKYSILTGVGFIIMFSLIFGGYQLGLKTVDTPQIAKSIIGSEIQIPILKIAHISAATVADYSIDGTADNVQFQAALDALPATGGIIQVMSSGNITFAATVSRAINNVSIIGTGQGTLFNYDDSHALFTVGAQTGWSFKDLSTDAGGITNYNKAYLENVKLGATTYASRPPDGQNFVGNLTGWASNATLANNATFATLSGTAITATNQSGGTINATQIKDDDLTSGRVVLATTNGQLTDDADLTFSGDTLTATKFVGDGSGITGISGTGEIVGILVAGNDASADIKASANYTCDGTDDEVQILQGIVALTAGRTKIEKVTLIGSFSVGYTSGTGCIDVPSYTEIELIGRITRENSCADKSLFHIAKQQQEIKIHGGIIDNNDANQSSRSSQWGIRIFPGSTIAEYTKGVYIYNITFYNFYVPAIYSVGLGTSIYSCNFYNSGQTFSVGGVGEKLSDCWVDNCTVAGYLNSDACIVSNCVFNESGYFSVTGGCFDTIVDHCLFIDTDTGIVPMYVESIKNVTISNNIFAPFQGDADASYCISVGADSHNIRIIGNTLLSDSVSGYCIYITSGAEDVSIEGNTSIGRASYGGGVNDSGTRTIIRNNDGFLGKGEERTYCKTISLLTQNDYNSLDNPFYQSVGVLSVDVYVSTKATSTSPNLDCGIGSSATTDYTTLFDDLPGETVGFYKSTLTTPGTQTVAQLWEYGSGNRYLNMSIKDAAATGMVAKEIIRVIGL